MTAITTSGLPFQLARVSARRWSAVGERSGVGFAFRLLVGFLVTIAIIEAAGIVILDRQARSSWLSQHAATQQANVKTFESIGRRTVTGAATFAEVDEALGVVIGQPGTITARVVDYQGAVVASGDASEVGATHVDSHILAALRSNTAYRGDALESAGSAGDVQFVTPLRFTGARYAYTVTYDGASLDSELAAMRRALEAVGVGGLLVGIVLFYFLGGRAVIHLHRSALARATRDGMTELPNQRAFQDDFPLAIASAARYDQPLALAVFDIDDFKFINDRHGHPYGDEIINRVAEVLRSGRPSDRAYRIGGDEFAAVIPHTDADGACAFARRLARQFDEVGVRVSLGVASLRPGHASNDILHSEADAALYEAKRRGGGQTVHFDDIEDAVTLLTADKKAAVSRLLDERHMDVHFQPIWDLSSDRLIGVEALARPDKRHGLTSPQEAFDIAEQLGRIHELDELCATAALSHAHELPAGVLLFVNVCPETLDMDGTENNWLSRAVEHAGLHTDQVIIEVTERFGGRAASVVKCLRHLKAQGFRIALDDVGTGNSGLAMLRSVPADYLKIDRSVIAAAPTEPLARGVLLAMATFADQTGAVVIAEGIEDSEMLEYLRSIHRTELSDTPIIGGGQGYQLGRPSPDMPNDILHPITAAA